MREKDQENTKNVGSFFKVLLSFFNVILWPIKYASLGAYYLVFYVLIVPFKYIIKCFW